MKHCSYSDMVTESLGLNFVIVNCAKSYIVKNIYCSMCEPSTVVLFILISLITENLNLFFALLMSQ